MTEEEVVNRQNNESNAIFLKLLSICIAQAPPQACRKFTVDKIDSSEICKLNT